MVLDDCQLEQVVSQRALWPGAPCERLLSAVVPAATVPYVMSGPCGLVMS